MRIASPVITICMIVVFSQAALCCVENIDDPATKHVACHWQVPVSQNTIAEVDNATGGIISDFGCSLDLNVSLQDLDRARKASATTSIPPQPFQCQVTTSGGVISATGGVGATIILQEGRVADVEFKPDNIQGLPGLALRLLLKYASTPRVRRSAAQWLEGQLSARAAKQ